MDGNSGFGIDWSHFQLLLLLSHIFLDGDQCFGQYHFGRFDYN
jgi:hypothetical protein